MISWNFTTAPKILLNILSQSEPELLALSLEILGNCNSISNTESIENLLDHPVPLVRKRAINVMLNLKKENWLISQLELIPQLDSCRQEDILECCLGRTEKINLHLVLHDELPDNWIHQLLKAWPKSSNYTDQLAVLNLVANKSQRSSLTALKWLIKQNIDPQLGADIYELLSNEKYQIFHNMLLKLFCCIPLSYCLSEWKYLSKNSESELVENFFRSQLRIHLQETPVELYLQELLNSKNVIELIRALECLPSEKIDTKFLENLKNHSNEEVIKSVNRHLVYYKQDDLNQRMSLASLKLEEGDVNQAHWILEELLSEASGDARYLYLFAQTKRELNDIGNARKLLQKSLQINSSQLDVRKSLARVELDAGNIRQGLSLILECLEKNNHDASLRLWAF